MRIPFSVDGAGDAAADELLHHEDVQDEHRQRRHDDAGEDEP
ncbi:hypothetical protein ACQEU6_39610 [Spirillospora sp. CA-108201]